MSNSRPQLTVRGLMILVALSAVLLSGCLWLFRMSRRSAEYQRVAAESAQLEIVYDGVFDHWSAYLRSLERARIAGLANASPDCEPIRRKATDALRRSRFHAQRHRIYERLAAFPWERTPNDAETASSNVGQP